MISTKFRICIKLADIPAWKIAYKAGISPNVLSKIMTGALRVKPGDQRVIKVATVLGLKPEECFEEVINGESGTFVPGRDKLSQKWSSGSEPLWR